MRYFIAIFFACWFSSIIGQELIGAQTVWNDSFREWTLYTDNEDVEGELSLKWAISDDWSEWIFEIDDFYGEIRLKWANNPNVWELRSNDEIVTMRTIWRDDFTKWRISDGNQSVTLESKYTSQFDDWALRESRQHEIFTVRQGDPRDWEIYEDQSLDLSLSIRMAIAFITLYHSIPKI